MFEYQYQFDLADGSTVSLFGEDYFGDKKVFWLSHISQLQHLCKRVAATGFPVVIQHLQADQQTQIVDATQFKAWLKANQPSFHSDSLDQL